MTDVTTKDVPAREVREGDFLVGLGQGYVFTAPEEAPDVRIADGRHLFQIPGEDKIVLIQFHDQYGEENYIVLGRDNPVTVRRAK